MATLIKETPYDVEEWAANTTLGHRVFNYNYRMTGTEIRNWDLVNTVDMLHESELAERIYIWERKGSGGKALIRVGITEAHTWHRAQSELQSHLHNSMRPRIPRSVGDLESVGDIGFAASLNGESTTAAFSFTRGNIAVSVASVGEEVVDVAAVARSIDLDFTEPPKQADIEAKKAEMRVPKPLRMKKGERAQVIEHLPEPVLRKGWLKVIVPDGEITREGDALIYTSPDAGDKEIETFIVIQE